MQTPRAELRAPTCVHDAAFAAKQPGSEVYGAFAFQGRPVWPVIDDDTSELVLRDLDSAGERARVKIPARDGTLFALSSLEMPGGPGVIVTQTLPALNEDEAATKHVFWLVRFEGGEPRERVRLPLPAEETLTDEILAVGDHLVVLRRAWLDEELAADGPPPDAATMLARDAKRPATLVVLDGGRRVVHTMPVAGATGLVPTGGTTIAVTRATGEPGGTLLRMFDVTSRAWVADEVRSPWMVEDVVEVGDRKIVIGTKPNAADVNARPFALATLSTDGMLSAWVPTALVGWGMAAVAVPKLGGVLLGVMREERPGSDTNIVDLATVGPDLALSPVTQAEAPRMAFSGGAFTIGDDVYVSGIGRVAKYVCR